MTNSYEYRLIHYPTLGTWQRSLPYVYHPAPERPPPPPLTYEQTLARRLLEIAEKLDPNLIDDLYGEYR